MNLSEFIHNKLSTQLIEGYDDVSIDSNILYEMLKTKFSDIIQYIDRPSGEFLEDIDIRLKNSDDLNIISSIIKKHKWYISHKSFDNLSITITAKHSKGKIENIPSKLYHATPTANIKSIMLRGLKPKSQDVRHKYPPRIYVADNVNSLIGLIRELKRWKDVDEYSIIEINTEGLNFVLNKDNSSAYRGCAYIQNIKVISPEHLKILENI